jgi:hypothetical protein
MRIDYKIGLFSPFSSTLSNYGILRISVLAKALFDLQRPLVAPLVGLASWQTDGLRSVPLAAQPQTPSGCNINRYITCYHLLFRPICRPPLVIGENKNASHD